VKYQVFSGIIAGIGLSTLAACSSGLPADSPSASPEKTEVATRTISEVPPSPRSIEMMTPDSPLNEPVVETITPIPSVMGELITIWDRFKFTEGPAWDPVLGVLFFSDIDDNRIYQLTLPNMITVFREPSNKSNGLAFDQDGCLLTAEHASRSVNRTQKNGTIETLASSYQGKQLNSPNDITVRSNGAIYFTDPTYGLEKRQQGVDFMGLYRLNQSGEVVLEGKFDKSPNGLVFSLDQKTLYLALTTGNQVMAFDVSEEGSLYGGRTFVTVDQPDGMTIDRAGNVYIAGLGGLYIFSPSGVQLGLIKTGYQPTNCEFGGVNRTTLFITAREALYSIDMSIAGYP
jgi:gluconolactonase